MDISAFRFVLPIPAQVQKVVRIAGINYEGVEREYWSISPSVGHYASGSCYLGSASALTAEYSWSAAEPALEPDGRKGTARRSTAIR